MLKRLLCGAAAALALAGPALAQTGPGFVDHMVPTTAYWTNLFTGKQDYLGTSGSGALARVTAPTFVGPILGAATATSLAVNGATLGANALAVAGTTDMSGTLVMSGGGIRINFGNLMFGASSDLLLSRAAAATFQFGAADAAAPVAQTVQAQSVVAGTSNTAAPNLTLNAPKGTGTGAGGSLVIQVAPAGSTGTAQNALAAALTIDSTKKATFAGDLKSTGTAPVPTGTGAPTIATGSTDTAGEVTAGASATSVVITFAGAKANAPFCTVTSQTQLAAFAYTISTTAISITQTATSGNKIDYACIQH